MISKQKYHIFFGLLFYLPLTANAAFITDKIVVDVYAERFDQGAVLKTLSSGASVEVLMSDGKYTRVRTADNITGWVVSKYLTNEKPTQLEYLELLSKSKATESKLRAAEEKLANSPAPGSDSANSDEIETLKKQVQNARWMKVEMMKARDRAEQAETKLNAERKKQSEKNKQNTDAQQQLAELRTKNAELEQLLTATMLVNEQQPETTGAEPIPSVLVTSPEIEKTNTGWSVDMPWFFGSLFTVLILGFVAGITWLDKRSRQRHGGFRIY